jgi:AmiR/NasT family two-component response regulator
MTDTAMEALAADSVGEELAHAHNKIAHLEIALKSSRRIGMALGILMAERKIREEQAFDLLRDASQHENRKLRDIAEDVIVSGTVELRSRTPAKEDARLVGSRTSEAHV